MKKWFNLRIATDILGFALNAGSLLGRALASFALAYLLYQTGSLLAKVNTVGSLFVGAANGGVSVPAIIYGKTNEKE